MRLTNERDQEILRAGISDAAASLLEFMPTMGTGDAITFGEGVALPTRIKFDMLPNSALPKSNTASFTQNWALDMPDENFLNEIVNRWRQQTFNPGSADYSVEMPAASPPSAAEPPAAGPARRQLGFGAQSQGLRPTLPAPEWGDSARHRTAQPAGVPMAGQFPAPPPPPQPQAPSQAKESLASLLKQFRS